MVEDCPSRGLSIEILMIEVESLSLFCLGKNYLKRKGG